MAPGKTISFHRHDNAEEILILEEGGCHRDSGGQAGGDRAPCHRFHTAQYMDFSHNTGTQDIHLFAVFSHQGFEHYLRGISVKPGEPVNTLNPDELPGRRAHGHARYWDSSKGPF
jgi:hypothetical protein